VAGVVRGTHDVLLPRSHYHLGQTQLVPVGGKGSHTTLMYEHPETDEVRTVTVPRGDPIPIGTLHDIADQAGANDFHEFCEWIEQTS
jgi:predicted RNA binding protein YcfA (HicA-like mRNA interferase family)